MVCLVSVEQMETISINVTGYTGAYTYTVFDSTPSPVAGGAGNTATNPFTIPTGLPAGNYTVQITETASPFCQDTTGVISVNNSVFSSRN